MGDTKSREIWVDNVKVIAFILVVLGHYFQSMTKSNILPSNYLYQWFIQTIYYFHVPLFFICSGYLYQKYSKVDSIEHWKTNVLKKTLALGVPYFTFSTATWVLKTMFASSTNDEVGGVFQSLFISPISPYWYLYCLFFIFLITPTFIDRKGSVVGLIVAITLKVFSIIWGGTAIYAISTVMANEIWFVIGMYLAILKCKYIPNKRNTLIAGLSLAFVFILLSVIVHKQSLEFLGLSTVLGLLACCAVILLMWSLYDKGKQNVFWRTLSKYTMPVFVMHTLFAAPLRIVLLNVGVTNAIIHVVIGICVSFLGPIVAAIIMKKTKWLEFLLYPNKFITIK